MKLLSVLGLLFVSSVCFGQEKQLPYDERGKFIYYEVVEIKDIPKDSLSVRADSYFKKRAKRIKLIAVDGDTSIKATGKMVISKTAFVLTHPSGEVQYNFYVEMRDGKYRFWLTDFNFVPYQRDRYGNFVAATIIGTPLENKPGKLNAVEWQSYIKSTAKEAKAFADEFKETMTGRIIPPATAKTEQSISTKKW